MRRVEPPALGDSTGCCAIDRVPLNKICMTTSLGFVDTPLTGGIHPTTAIGKKRRAGVRPTNQVTFPASFFNEPGFYIAE